MEMGAGTFHTATFLRAVGPEPWSAAYVQPSRRPTDGRYGENPFRVQRYYQYQVVIKPSPPNLIDLYLGSLAALGIDTRVHDVRLVEDNWESPTLGAWGLGWEVWLNGMEVTQFTYFQQVGGLDCRPVMGEITYGLERLAMYLQGVESFFDLVWTDGPLGQITYRDVYHQNEVEQSRYNFELADVGGTLAPVRRLRAGMPAAARGRRAAARVRAHARVLAHVQPARCAQGDLRHRAAAIHPARAHAGARRRRGVLREPRSARLPDEASHDDAAISWSRSAPRSCHPRTLLALADAFAAGIGRGLDEAGLVHGAVERYATPRRLAVRVRRAGRDSSRTGPSSGAGPPVTAAFDAQGAPTQAALAFARSCGVEVGVTRARRDAEGRVARPSRRANAGAAAATLLPGIVRAALEALPIARRMRWGAGDAEFVRPVHWVVMLLRHRCRRC